MSSASTSTSTRINDFVVSFANVNGTGSASANTMFAKSVFRMGIPISAKNLFPSNIQGLPTWYEVRVSEKGYLGRRAGIDMMVGLNAQSFAKDVRSVLPGGYFVYDSTKLIRKENVREDITYIGIPMMQICMQEYADPRQRLLFKNLIYVGALARLMNIDLDVVRGVIADEFKKKPKLIEPN
ncbi:MAG: 2-oxoacid:acceptor oxidoreductase family protein, partial [Candidatus Kapaibacterium sp.]